MSSSLEALRPGTAVIKFAARVPKEKPLPAQLGEIIGGYELVEVLSHGGMGCVYRAVHARLGRTAAVKVLATALALDEELVARFFREARIVNELRHPNIVDIFDFVELESPRRLACIMEYIEGPTLKQVVREKRLTVQQAIHATLQLVSALRVVHSLNVIHRDLKPTNIIVTGDRRSDLSRVPSVKVLDFGIAKVEDSPGEHKTASGTMLGTPAYMAPEQVAADSVSTAADIYALGELLYEMVSGRRAFPGSRAAVLKSKMTGSIPLLPLPQGMRAADRIRLLVAKCIAHDPVERPTLAQFEEEVRAIQAFSTGDLGLEILDGEALTDIHEIATRPIDLPTIVPPPIEEPNTIVVPNEPIPRSPSTFDDAPLTEASAAATSEVEAPKRTGLLIGAAAAAFAALGLALMIGLAQPPPQEPAPSPPPEEPAQVLEPITLSPDLPAPKRAPDPEPRSIAVSSRPSAVVLDAKTDARLGRTPMEVQLPAGTKMELILVAPGRRPHPLLIDGKRARVTVELERTRPKRRPKRTTATKPAPPPPPKPKSLMPEW